MSQPRGANQSISNWPKKPDPPASTILGVVVAMILRCSCDAPDWAVRLRAAGFAPRRPDAHFGNRKKKAGLTARWERILAKELPDHAGTAALAEPYRGGERRYLPSLSAIKTSFFGNFSNSAAGLLKFVASTSTGLPAIHCDKSIVA